MCRALPEHWALALVSMQTMGAYGGRTWYSVARMNGGSSSRPALAATPGMGAASRWRRDVVRLLESRDDTLVAHDYLRAAAYLTQSEQRGARGVRPLLVYSLCLAGRLAAANQLAQGLDASNVDQRQFRTWLHATFGVGPG